MTEMQPVVVNPSVSFETLFDGLAGASSEDEPAGDPRPDHREARAARSGACTTRSATSTSRRPARRPRRRCRRFREGPAAAVRDWSAARPGLGRFFDFEGPRGAPPIIPISYHPDQVTGVTRGYGDGVKPADFIDAFTAFVRDNPNRIAALQIVLTRPRDLTRESLRELRLALDAAELHRARAARRLARRDERGRRRLDHRLRPPGRARRSAGALCRAGGPGDPGRRRAAPARRRPAAMARADRPRAEEPGRARPRRARRAALRAARGLPSARPGL